MSDRGLGLALAALAAIAGNDAATDLLHAADAARVAVEEGVIHALVGWDGVDLYVQGPDKTLCVVRDGKQKGRRVLRVGDRMWLLAPGSTRAIPIGPHERLSGKSAFMDLLRLDLSRRYLAVLRDGTDDVGGVRCRVLDLRARDAKAPYASGTLWVGEKDRLPRRLVLALPSGKASTEIVFTEYGTVGRGKSLRRMDVRDLLVGGEDVTPLAVVRYETRTLDPALFTPEGARAFDENEPVPTDPRGLLRP